MLTYGGVGIKWTLCLHMIINTQFKYRYLQERRDKTFKNYSSMCVFTQKAYSLFRGLYFVSGHYGEQ